MSSFSGIKNTLLAEQADEEAAPAHDPNLKNSRPRSDMLRGLLSLFMDNGSIFSGVLRRLVFVLFVLSLCSDHDDTHCYRVAFLIGSFVKRSAHVVDFCRLFPEQIIAIPSPAWHK